MSYLKVKSWQHRTILTKKGFYEIPLLNLLCDILSEC